VSGFDEHCSMKVWLRIESASDACGTQSVGVSAWMEPYQIAVGSFNLPGGGYPHDVVVYLDGADVVPGTDAVGAILPPVAEFAYSLDDGGFWSTIGTAGPTTWYVMPSATGLPVEGKRYDHGLDRVVGYAWGLSCEEDIAGAATTGIDVDIYYDPGDTFPGHPLWLYSRGIAVCLNNARLLAYLMRASGLTADKMTTFGGATPTQVDLYPPEVGPVSCRIERPGHDGAPLPNPQMSYHAIVLGSAMAYDPSYGQTNPVLEISDLCAPYSHHMIEQDIWGYLHVICCCNPTDPDYIPVQQWAFDYPPGPLPDSIVYVECGAP
jgi:hypothetical protein